MIDGDHINIYSDRRHGIFAVPKRRIRPTDLVGIDRNNRYAVTIFMSMMLGHDLLCTVSVSDDTPTTSDAQHTSHPPRRNMRNEIHSMNGHGPA